MPLATRLDETSLHRQKTATVTDRQPIQVDYPHKELLTLLLADVCEIRENRHNHARHQDFTGRIPSWTTCYKKLGNLAT